MAKKINIKRKKIKQAETIKISIGPMYTKDKEFTIEREFDRKSFSEAWMSHAMGGGKESELAYIMKRLGMFLIEAADSQTAVLDSDTKK